MKVIGNLTLTQGSAIQNFTVENIATDPVNPNAGQSWFNTASKEYKFYDGTTVQIFFTKSAFQAAINKFASTANGEGASLIGIEDADAHFTATTVEGALKEEAVARKALESDIKSVAANKGADLVGLHDAEDKFSATTVGGALVELHTAMTANSTGVTGLVGAVGTTNLAAVNYGSSLTYIANTDTLIQAIGKLDAASKSNSSMTLQDVYNNSVTDDTDPANKFVSIKLATNKDFRIVDDTDDTVYFGIDSETGTITISGDLRVSGTTTTVESTVTKFSSQFIEVGAPGTVGLTLKPGDGVTPAADLISAYISADVDATPVFRVSSNGKIYGTHGEFSGNLTVAGTINDVDVAALKTAYDAHVAGTADKHDSSVVTFSAPEGSTIAATDVQGAIVEVEAAGKTLKTDLGSTAVGKGAALVGISTVEGLTATNAQGAIVEVLGVASSAMTTATTAGANLISLTNDLGSTAEDKGASLIGIQDAAGYFTSENVEGALKELFEIASASANYLYDGSVAATSHNITHSLASKYVSVVVVDSSDDVVIPENIKFVDANNLTVTFGSAVACKIFVSK